MSTFFHADDFGVCLEASKSILECFEKGQCNSVSLIVNSPEAKGCYELIREEVKQRKMRCAVHLNFVEGKCVSENGTETIPHLVDENGCFNRSFFSVYKVCQGKERDVLKEEMKKEIGAQLELYSRITGERKLSVDSHQHYHMIPTVWEALWEVIESEGYEVEYLRIPVDPLGPVLKNGLLFKVPFINYIKWVLLHSCKKRCFALFTPPVKIPVFFGIPFTCRMEKHIVAAMLADYENIAKERNADLELMFHPGAVRNPDKLLDKKNEQLVEFYGSAYRDKEKETLLLSANRDVPS